MCAALAAYSAQKARRLSENPGNLSANGAAGPVIVEGTHMLV
jgi:hypothetical protein